MPETVTQKKQKEIEFDIDSNLVYDYVLCVKNDARGRVFDENGKPRPEQEYPSRRNILMRSSIVWPKDTADPWNPDKKRSPGRHLIRYYDGCTTLFVDDQPREKETIEQLVHSTRETFFIHGHFRVNGYDAMLKIFMDWASWNEDSPFRVLNIDPIYKMLDPEKSRAEQAASIDDVEKALKLAKDADESKMMIHAKFMDVPTVDYATGRPLSTSAIRAEYRNVAMKETKRFLQTYNDESMHLKYWIEEAMKSGEISLTKIPNRAAWARKGVVICDISGLSSPDVILNRLIEEAKTNKEFEAQLRALYN